MFLFDFIKLTLGAKGARLYTGVAFDSHKNGRGRRPRQPITNEWLSRVVEAPTPTEMYMIFEFYVLN